MLVGDLIPVLPMEHRIRICNSEGHTLFADRVGEVPCKFLTCGVDVLMGIPETVLEDDSRQSVNGVVIFIKGVQK